MRHNDRLPNQLRNIKFTRNYTRYAEGSVLVEYGETKVICTASITTNKPRFLKDKNKGWLTSEYGMLPRSTHERIDREAVKGNQNGRTQEIQRLIGRSLRSAINLEMIPDHSIFIDCDVIQADGGTRTAAISGASVALADAIRHAYANSIVKHNPLKHLIASVSVGIVDGTVLLDLDYEEDSKAQTDMNIVMNDIGQFIEIQGTAETSPFSEQELNEMINLAKQGIIEINQAQKAALGF
jgi:ribonuclease PH